MYISAEKEECFVASFREESHKWFLFISEMWSGKRVAELIGDPTVLQLAKQNVLILNAFLRRF